MSNIYNSFAQPISNTCDVSVKLSLFGKSLRLKQLKDATPYGPVIFIKNNSLIDTVFFKTLFNSDENDSSYIYAKLYVNRRGKYIKKIQPQKSPNRAYERVVILPNAEYRMQFQLASYFFIRKKGKYKLESYYRTKCTDEITICKLNDIFFTIN